MADGIDFTIEGADELAVFFKGFPKKLEREGVTQFLLDSAIEVDRAARRNLKEMVYDRPEGSYKRTTRLFTTTQATGKVDFVTGEAKTGVVSKVGYAKDVLLGLGWNRTIGPRPYLTKALQDAKAAILKLGKNLLG